MITPHRFPSEMPRPSEINAQADGHSLDIIKAQSFAFASYECAGAHELVVELPFPAEKAKIGPKRIGTNATCEGNRLTIPLEGPACFLIEDPQKFEFHVYALPPAENAPTGDDVICFEAGKVHERGEVRLKPGQTLWLEPGAVLRGNIRATEAHGVRIGGYGVLDNGYWGERSTRRRSIVLEYCRDARVDDILMINPTTWMLTVGGCFNTTIRGLRQIGECMSSDGIDVVGSTKTHVSKCFLRNNDDNIAVKALNLDRGAHPSQVEGSEPYLSFAQNVEDLLVEDCVFYNDRGGSAMEIGYETRCDTIRDITFRNIDVLAVHSHGSVFGIHSGDRALIENVVWENIRVEHHYDKLIDLRLLHSRWNRDPAPGQVKGVVIRDAQIHESSFNEGYTINLVGGFNAAHRVSDVLIENFVVNGERITDIERLQIFTRHCDNVRLK